ncbi:ABC transporter permease [Virgibacillus alimentarius]|uniref:ABC-2 type transport system permease protein n=1 Tax=Virgibacillus alimentarius TaxID=698769 RepID=A0ABS4SBV2_9BACI|nr:ABC transporter permease [Virgibacillus alimentarius]MBP2258996.1 ABC-2 type transport system permease protein [Virgibacillus alimentarius]
MHKLIVNEWTKIFKRAGTYVMIAMILLGVVAMGTLIKMTEEPDQAGDQWRDELSQQIKEDKKDLKDMPASAGDMKRFLEKDIAINQYRLDNEIAPPSETTGWSFIDESSALISFAGLFAIIIAAGIVASEFSTGTIKLLLIRPIRRYKILLSKYVTVVLFGLFMLAVLFISSAGLGFGLFGTGDGNSVHLAYADGEVIEQSQMLHLVKIYLLSSIDVLMLVTLAFMISAVFRNNSLAIGISIFLLMMGGNVTSLIAAKYDWAKYILFANTNLMQYFNGTPVVEGMTLGFSIVMLCIYFILFMALAFGVFTKRDVAA